MEPSIPQGTERVIDGRRRVYYDGYWIRAYDVPSETLEHTKRLIEALTRRLFNHVEHGINVPGHRLEEVRQAFAREVHPERKRVKGAMLAGALFNRATDIFRKVVELQSLGVKIEIDNELLNECGEHLKEAFALGRLVRHRTGEEGIDELWGEPLKAFTFPLHEFYRSRYIKMAQAMEAIDRICRVVTDTLKSHAAFSGVDQVLDEFAVAARTKCETLRTDPDIFEVWPTFVVASEQVTCFEPEAPREAGGLSPSQVSEALSILRDAATLVWSITRARVPMPKSTANLIARCQGFREASVGASTPPALRSDLAQEPHNHTN